MPNSISKFITICTQNDSNWIDYHTSKKNTVLTKKDSDWDDRKNILLFKLNNFSDDIMKIFLRRCNIFFGQLNIYVNVLARIFSWLKHIFFISVTQWLNLDGHRCNAIFIWSSVFCYDSNNTSGNGNVGNSMRQPPKRMLPPSIPISQPVRSPKFGSVLPSPSTSHVHAKYDVLVWFEICELAPNGEYVPSVVDHSDDLPCRGLFLLHQGIQRRIRITIVHEHASELRWKDVRELVVGRIRNTPEPEEEDNDSSVLSLGLFPGEYLEIPGDDRSMFRFEAAWDSSLHNSALLNRVTSYGEQIFMTISAYLEVCPSFFVCNSLPVFSKFVPSNEPDGICII